MPTSFLILTTIICWGIGSFFLKLAMNSMHPIIVSMLMTSLYVIMVPIGLYVLKVSPSFNYDGTVYALLGGLGMCVGSLAYFFALQSGGAGEITASTSVYPAITLLISAFILKEELTIHKIFGCCLALLSVFILTWK